jgi:hypothetical protein
MKEAISHALRLEGWNTHVCKNVCSSNYTVDIRSIVSSWQLVSQLPIDHVHSVSYSYFYILVSTGTDRLYILKLMLSINMYKLVSGQGQVSGG